MAIVEVDDWQAKSGSAEKITALMVEWKTFTEMYQWYAAFWADSVGQEYFRKLNELMVFSRAEEFWPRLAVPAASQKP